MPTDKRTITKATAVKPTAEETWDALNELRRSLNDAYWQIADQNEADRVLSTAHTIDGIQDAIDKAEIAAGTPEYAQLTATMDAVRQRLDTLKGKIDDLVHNIELATKVVGAIDKALAMAGKYFA